MAESHEGVAAFVQVSGPLADVRSSGMGSIMFLGEPVLAFDKRIWPCGRYEVYEDPESEHHPELLGGFHRHSEAEECAERFPGSVVLDRADRFVS